MQINPDIFINCACLFSYLRKKYWWYLGSEEKTCWCHFCELYQVTWCLTRLCRTLYSALIWSLLAFQYWLEERWIVWIAGCLKTWWLDDLWRGIYVQESSDILREKTVSEDWSRHGGILEEDENSLLRSTGNWCWICRPQCTWIANVTGLFCTSFLFQYSIEKHCKWH